MATSNPTVRWFHEIGRNDIASRRLKRPSLSMIREAGGKGANLAEMVRAGIPVPAGFVVTADTYFDFSEPTGLKSLIDSSTSSLDVSDSAALAETSGRLKAAISETPMPPYISNALKQAYRQLGGGFVAVRSSATAEDLPDASFAGQQSTYLNVSGDEDVVRAVKDCWASLFESRAIFYRAENGFDHVSTGIAVVVQRMVQSEVSGVIFTVEPVTNDISQLCIEAIYGLGEAVVSGQVSPDNYLVDKHSMKIKEKTVVPQEWQLTRNPNSTSDTHAANTSAAVPQEMRKQQKLGDASILRLAEMGQRLERHYGHPQDIEWALQGGKLYILQTRPVTTYAQATHATVAQGIDAPILLTGAGASPGVGAGPARIVRDASEIDQVRQGDVLVAEMTTPDFVPAMKRASAIITDRGGRTCHAAIVGRELGVPCVVGAEVATSTVSSGQQLTVDGATGKVYEGIVPIQTIRAPESRYVHTRTKVYVNLADPDLAVDAASRNVDGVGLLRAEFMAAHIGQHPRYMLERGRGRMYTEKLARGIGRFVEAFNPRPVVYRTTDFKTNEYRNLEGGDEYEELEENPMLGFRGCSRYLADRDTFRLEVDAITKVRQEYDNLYVMIPFVRTPEEMAQVKRLLWAEGAGDVKLWMMVEVPSNVIMLDRFLDVGIDGVSIGSNDLTQLVLGVDRDNSKYANVFDERNEAVLWCLERIIKTAKSRQVKVSICGQGPSFYPELTTKLVNWGIDSVSVSPDMIDRTRDTIGQVEERLEVLPAQS